MSTIRAWAYGERTKAAASPRAEVVEVLAVAADQARVLAPGDRGPEELGRHIPRSSMSSAARQTAVTMFW